MRVPILSWYSDHCNARRILISPRLVESSGQLAPGLENAQATRAPLHAAGSARTEKKVGRERAIEAATGLQAAEAVIGHQARLTEMSAKTTRDCRLSWRYLQRLR